MRPPVVEISVQVRGEVDEDRVVRVELGIATVLALDAVEDRGGNAQRASHSGPPETGGREASGCSRPFNFIHAPPTPLRLGGTQQMASLHG
ncbi:hypothetical protein GCM10027067_38820 [Pseudactinotalea suaedae]